MVINKGYRDIIVIRTYSMGVRRRVDTSGLNIISINPSENLGPILDFRNERAKRNLAMGYCDAMKVFAGLKGKRYYVKPLDDEAFFINYLVNMADEKIEKIGKLFGLEGYSGKRALFENIVPRLADLLGVPPDASYEDISISLLENVAETAGVERFEIYSFLELLSETSKKHEPVRDDLLKEIPGFLKGIDIVAKIVKDRIISIIAGEIFESVTGDGYTPKM
jgi:NTE family protein